MLSRDLEALIQQWKQFADEEDNDEFGLERKSKLEDCIEDLEAVLRAAVQTPARPFEKNGITQCERVVQIDWPNQQGTVLECSPDGVLVRWDNGTTGDLVWRDDVAYNAYRLQIVRRGPVAAPPPHAGEPQERGRPWDGCSGIGRPSCTATECMFGLDQRLKPKDGICAFVDQGSVVLSRATEAPRESFEEVLSDLVAVSAICDPMDEEPPCDECAEIFRRLRAAAAPRVGPAK